MKMDDLLDELGFLFIGLVVGFFIGASVIAGHYQQEAIEHGYAEYSQTTGDWQWKVDTE